MKYSVRKIEEKDDPVGIYVFYTKRGGGKKRVSLYIFIIDFSAL